MLRCSTPRISQILRRHIRIRSFSQSATTTVSWLTYCADVFDSSSRKLWRDKSHNQQPFESLTQLCSELQVIKYRNWGEGEANQSGQYQFRKSASNPHSFERRFSPTTTTTTTTTEQDASSPSEWKEIFSLQEVLQGLMARKRNHSSSSSCSLSLSSMNASPDGEWIALCVTLHNTDHDNSNETCVCVVKNLSKNEYYWDDVIDECITARLLPRSIGQTPAVVYVTADPNDGWRSSHAWIRTLGNTKNNNKSQEKDVLLLEETDPTCALDLSISKNGDWLFIDSTSMTDNELFALRGSDYDNHNRTTTAESAMRRVLPRMSNWKYALESQLDAFVLWIQDEHGRSFLYRITATELPWKPWETLSSSSSASALIASFPTDMPIAEWDVLNDCIALYTTKKVILVRTNNNDNLQDEVSPPDGFTTIAPLTNPSVEAQNLSVSVSGLTVPAAAVWLDIHSGQYTSISSHSTMDVVTGTNKRFDTIQSATKQLLVTLSDPMNHPFVTETLLIPSLDDVSIPLTIVRSRGGGRSSLFSSEGSDKRCVLMVYGAYGASLDLSFDPVCVALLSRGMTVAYAHVRGGGECGIQWHQQGKGEQGKKRSVLDVLACARALICMEYAQLGLMAASAGGYTAALAGLLFPSLFQSIVLNAPHLSVEPLQQEMEWQDRLSEFEQAEFHPHWDPIKVLRRIVSQHNNHKQQPLDRRMFFPSLLLSGSLTDPRVSPGAWVLFSQLLNALPHPRNITHLMRVIPENGHNAPSEPIHIADQVGFLDATLSQWTIKHSKGVPPAKNEVQANPHK